MSRQGLLCLFALGCLSAGLALASNAQASQAQEVGTRSSGLPSGVVAHGFVLEETDQQERLKLGLPRECHAATVVEAAPGTIVTAWFGGTSEGDNDVTVWTASRTGAEDPWSIPEEVATGFDRGQEFPTWNPVLFKPTDRSLLLYYKVGPSPREWWGRVLEGRVDTSQAGVVLNWGEDRALPSGILGPIRNKPLQLDSGETTVWLSGTSTEGRRRGGAAPESAGRQDVWRAHFERSTDFGATWSKSQPAVLTIPEDGALQVIQPTLLDHGDGRVQALLRSQNAAIVETWSDDYGKTWGPLRPTALPNPNAAVDGVRLADGRFLLVYNHQLKKEGKWVGSRRRLNVALSDDGETWKAALVLENDPPAGRGGAFPPGEYSYPAVVQASDGLVHVVYTWRRRNVRHVVLDPAQLKAIPFENGDWPDWEGLRLPAGSTARPATGRSGE